ncbi:hypothetical protein [Pseudonocardia sp. TRM90224]|uniref:hypothetical protein n=1 Tax=Pseudonocardia sp. TRM90224 TaxID=2812678 RepID=UPI001E2CF2D5|nr:hypothetical protein [Pseudonocardia sp. TRM90224]
MTDQPDEFDEDVRRDVNEAGRRALHLVMLRTVDRDDTAWPAELKRIVHEEDAMFAGHIVSVLMGFVDTLLSRLTPAERDDFLARSAGYYGPDDLQDL